MMGIGLSVNDTMTNRKVWFITGAGRGMGVDFVKAALAAGHAVVGTGRDPDAVAKALGDLDDLRVVKLDVTSRADAEAAVREAVDRFGRIDVLVNNAGTFDAGYFEELTPEQVERQLATSLLGPMNVTRAVLPIMRKQRSGHIISISSGAGLVGFEFCSAYVASKFGLEGWMESLRPEVEPFGIHTTIVNPGFFRTKLLTKESMTFADRRTTPTAERSNSSGGRRRTGSNPAIQPSSRERSSGSLPSSRRRAASSPAPMPSPSPSRRSPISRRRSTPTTNCPRRSLSTSPRPPEARSSPRCARASDTAPKDGCIENVSNARLIQPTDALVAVSRACICGSNLWAVEPNGPNCA